MRLRMDWEYDLKTTLEPYARGRRIEQDTTNEQEAPTNGREQLRAVLGVYGFKEGVRDSR